MPITMKRFTFGVCLTKHSSKLRDIMYIHVCTYEHKTSLSQSTGVYFRIVARDDYGLESLVIQLAHHRSNRR